MAFAASYVVRMLRKYPPYGDFCRSNALAPSNCDHGCAGKYYTFWERHRGNLRCRRGCNGNWLFGSDWPASGHR